MLEESKKREAWIASHVQANNMREDHNGVVYAPTNVRMSKEWKSQSFDWTPLIGHFITVYGTVASEVYMDQEGGCAVGKTTVHTTPKQTVLDIMRMTQIPLNKVLVLNNKRLEYLSWPLLKYGVPDNTRVDLTLEDMVEEEEEEEEEDEESESSSEDYDVEDLRE